VDLVWSGGAASVQIDAQASVVATLTNAADFTATGVAVTAVLAAGARLDQAALGGVVCAIAGQAVTCPVQSLPARGSVSLTLTLTGTATGLTELTLSAMAAEAERNPGDNELTRSITVTAPPNTGSGGGGALSIWAAAVLLLTLRLRGRKVLERRRPS
jgi:hypothetical protein